MPAPGWCPAGDEAGFPGASGRTRRLRAARRRSPRGRTHPRGEVARPAPTQAALPEQPADSRVSDHGRGADVGVDDQCDKQVAQERRSRRGPPRRREQDHPGLLPDPAQEPDRRHRHQDVGGHDHRPHHVRRCRTPGMAPSRRSPRRRAARWPAQQRRACGSRRCTAGRTRQHPFDPHRIHQARRGIRRRHRRREPRAAQPEVQGDHHQVGRTRSRAVQVRVDERVAAPVHAAQAAKTNRPPQIIGVSSTVRVTVTSGRLASGPKNVALSKPASANIAPRAISRARRAAPSRVRRRLARSLQPAAASGPR